MSDQTTDTVINNNPNNFLEPIPSISLFWIIIAAIFFSGTIFFITNYLL